MDAKSLSIGMVATAIAGCSFGLGETVTFATRNVTVSGALTDRTFESTTGTAEVVQASGDLEAGVRIFIGASDADTTVSTELDFGGNLGALCPGSRVVLEGDNVLTAVEYSGAPVDMLAQLSELELSMFIAARTAGTEEFLAPRRVEISAVEGADSFSVMRFASTSMVDGEERVIIGEFEVARVIEDTNVPGWEGDTWEGQPIDTWE